MIWRELWIVCVLVYSTAAVNSGDESLTCSLTPEKAKAVAGKLAAEMARANYSVSIGRASWFLPFDGEGPENPDGTYMEFSFPRAEAPEHFCDVNGETCLPLLPTLTQSTLLGPLDAVVFLGCSPPPSRYFSLDMLVSSRWSKMIDPSLPSVDPSNINQEDYFWPGCPFGDALNNLRIPSFDWLKPLSMVQSFNKKTSSDLRAALSKHNVNAGVEFIVGTQELNSSQVFLFSTRATQNYTDALPDSFRPLARWSVPLNDTGSDIVQDYLGQDWPVLVFRKEPVDGKVPTKDMFQPELTPRSTGVSEEKELGADVTSAIKAATKDITANFNLSSTYDSQATNYLEGEMDDWAQVLTDSEYGGDYLNIRDAVYGNPDPDDDWSVQAPILKPKGVAVLTGVAHTAFGSTTYNNVGVMDPLLTYSQWVNDEQMKGCRSGEETSHVFQLFFVGYKLEGGCNDNSKHFPSGCCFEVPRPSPVYEDGEIPLLVGERSYLNPQTKTGPAFDEILPVSMSIFG